MQLFKDFVIPNVESSYKGGNEALKKLASKNPQGYEIHFKKNKNNILSYANEVQGRVLVLGFGNGDDIPLEEMALKFEEIDLVDMDISAMQKAVDKLSPTLQNKVHLIKQDLSGLISYISKRFAEFDFNVPEIRCLENASQILSDSINHAEPIQLSRKYNFVVSSMLTSQLHANIQG